MATIAQFKKEEGVYRILHEHYATDRYALGETIVKADSKQEAMDKLNAYLATKPDGAYTPLPCKNIKHVYKLNILQ